MFRLLQAARNSFVSKQRLYFSSGAGNYKCAKITSKEIEEIAAISKSIGGASLKASFKKGSLTYSGTLSKIVAVPFPNNVLKIGAHFGAAEPLDIVGSHKVWTGYVVSVRTLTDTRVTYDSDNPIGKKSTLAFAGQVLVTLQDEGVTLQDEEDISEIQLSVTENHNK